MPNTLIPWGFAVEEITRDLNEALAPVIQAMKDAGASEEEIKLELDRAMFDAFRGLHKFPDSHRP